MDHPTWVPASASSAGGASASANQEWREQLEALFHWTEEDLSAKEIEELKLIKDMVTSEEQGSFLAYENDTVPAHASALIQIDSDEEVARRLQERLDGVVPPGPPPQHGRRATLQCATGLPLFPCRAAGQPAKRQRTSGASPSPELSVAKIKEAFGRAAPDGLLDVGLVNTLMRHFRMKFTVQELEDRVNAVVGNGHLLVFPEFLSLMAGKMTGTEDAFMDAEEADRCSAATTTAAAGTGGKGRRRLPDADAHGGRLPDAERRPRDASPQRGPCDAGRRQSLHALPSSGWGFQDPQHAQGCLRPPSHARWHRQARGIRHTRWPSCPRLREGCTTAGGRACPRRQACYKGATGAGAVAGAAATTSVAILAQTATPLPDRGPGRPLGSSQETVAFWDQASLVGSQNVNAAFGRPGGGHCSAVMTDGDAEVASFLAKAGLAQHLPTLRKINVLTMKNLEDLRKPDLMKCGLNIGEAATLMKRLANHKAQV